jgi:hypothetical protein
VVLRLDCVQSKPSADDGTRIKLMRCGREWLAASREAVSKKLDQKSLEDET